MKTSNEPGTENKAAVPAAPERAAPKHIPPAEPPVTASAPARAPGLPAARGSLVLALDDVSATLPRVGGKGASLARMARTGFPVPPDFLITTDAYRAFIDANALQTPIVALAKDATRSSEESSKEIRALFDPSTDHGGRYDRSCGAVK